MKLWAKISSLALMGFAIYSIHLGISFVELEIDNQILPLSTTIIFFLSTLFSAVSIFLFYSPVFYYGWVKKPRNELMKYLAKALTIIFPVLLVIGLISPWGIGFKDIPTIIPMFLIIVPLYYYGWLEPKNESNDVPKKHKEVFKLARLEHEVKELKSKLKKEGKIKS